MDVSSKDSLLRRFKEIWVLFQGAVILRSGEKGDYYCDVKNALGYPDILTLIAEEIGRLLGEDITCVAWAGYGGLPLATAVCLKYNFKLSLVRDKIKDHGTGKIIDGYIPTFDDKVVLLDDVFTTGSSLRETHATLTHHTKAQILQAIVVVKRGEADLPFPVFYLFTIDELISET